MSEFILYWNLLSQPSRSVKALMDIGKLPGQLKHLNMMQQEQRKREYRQIYPLCKVPFLKSGDFVMGESGAIMMYLCQRYPHLAPYYGETAQQRAITNQYISWYQNVFRPYMLGPFRLHVTAMHTKTPVYEHQLKNTIYGVWDLLEKFNQILAKNKTKFIAGDKLTIPDLLFFFEMTNMVYFNLDHEKYSEVKRWHADVFSVPEVKAIMIEWQEATKPLIKKFETLERVQGMPKL